VNAGDWGLAVAWFIWFCVVFSAVVWLIKHDRRRRRAEREGNVAFAEHMKRISEIQGKLTTCAEVTKDADRQPPSSLGGRPEHTMGP
jgi:hypothetical protein